MNELERLEADLAKAKKTIKRLKAQIELERLQSEFAEARNRIDEWDNAALAKIKALNEAFYAKIETIKAKIKALEKDHD